MIFVDANIFMYAAGSDHSNKKPSIRFLEKLAMSPSAHQFCTNTEVLQEILHRYKSIGLAQTGFDLFDAVVNLGLIIYAVELQDMKLAKQAMRQYPQLSTRDAVHLGVVIRRDVKKIVSYDQDFSIYPGIERIEPQFAHESKICP